jgi:hypothetical protein
LKDLSELHYSEILNTQPNFTDNLVEGRQLPLPKTFSTKKGPLLLFSEETLLSQAQQSQQNQPKGQLNQNFNSNEIKQTSQSLITIGELRRSILKFPSLTNFENSNEDMSGLFEREGTLETLTMFKFNANSHLFAKDDRMIDKIRPGYSAKRYLSSWTKHWQPQLFEKLSKQGQLKVENLFEPNEIMPNLRHRIDDNLSRVPPAYRIPKHWLSINVAPLKGYRFYRIHNEFLGIDSVLDKSKAQTPDEVIQVKISCIVYL